MTRAGNAGFELNPQRVDYPLPPKLDVWESIRIADDLIHQGAPKYRYIGLDFSPLVFVKPSGVVYLANIIEFLKRNGCRTTLLFPLDKRNNRKFAKTEALKYLDDCHFFRRYVGQDIFPDSQVRTTTIPLQIIAQSQSHSWVESTFIPWIAARTNIEPSAFAEIKVAIKELFNNITDHSGQSEGFAFAQIYPAGGNFIVSLSDFGVGIPHNVKRVRPGLSDAQCLLLAAQEGFTTSTTGRNLGLGLDTLIRYVVDNNRGRVRIRSGEGQLLCTATDSGTKRSYYPASRCLGTLIEFMFQIDRLNEPEILGEDTTLQWS